MRNGVCYILRCKSKQNISNYKIFIAHNPNITRNWGSATKKGELCTDPKKLDGLKIRFDVKEFGIVPDSFRLVLV